MGQYWKEPEWEPTFKRVPVSLTEPEYIQLFHLADRLSLPMTGTFRLGLFVLQDVVKLMSDCHVPLWYLHSSEPFTLRQLMGWIEPRQPARPAGVELVPVAIQLQAEPVLVKLGPLDEPEEPRPPRPVPAATQPVKIDWLETDTFVRILVVAAGLVAAGFIVGMFVGAGLCRLGWLP